MAIPILPAVSGAIQAARGLFAPSRPAPSGPALDQESFLRLLVAELRNQDPLAPLDNDRFVQQTAAFSQLDELARIRQLLDRSGGQGDLGQAAALLGRRATALAARFTYAGATVSLPLDLGAPTRAARLEVLDQAGRVVASLPLGALPAGPRSISFPPAGTTLPAGSYSYRVVDLDALGRPAAVALASGTVSGVRLEGGQPLLQIGPARVRLGDLASVEAGSGA